MGISLSIKENPGIDKDRPYLIMGNHQSLFDLFVIPAAIPFCFVGIQAAEHFKYPFIGNLFKKWGNIPIDRFNLKRAIKSLNQAKKTFECGMSIGVLPEGHRTRTGEMGPFKKGPFHLAKEVKADILPIGINGLYKYNPKGSFIITPGKVTVKLGKPVFYDEYQENSIEEIRDIVYKKIKNLSQ